MAARERSGKFADIGALDLQAFLSLARGLGFDPPAAEWLRLLASSGACVVDCGKVARWLAPEAPAWSPAPVRPGGGPVPVPRPLPEPSFLEALSGVEVTAGAESLADICAHEGKIYAAPNNSDRLLIYDTLTQEVQGVDVTPVAPCGFKFCGICAHGGKIYAAPSCSDRLLIYDPLTQEVQGVDVTCVATGGHKFAGICAHGGKIYAAPSNSDRLLIYDPLTQEVQGVDVRPVATGANKFRGICAHEGKIYAAPNTSDRLLIYDPLTQKVQGVDVTPVTVEAFKFRGVCSHGGKIYAAPSCSDQLLIYDPLTQEVQGVDVTPVAIGVDKFNGICAHDGLLYAAPSNSDQLLIYDPLTQEVQGADVTSVAVGGYKFRGICAQGSKIYAATPDSDRMLVYLPAPPELLHAECELLKQLAAFQKRVFSEGEGLGGDGADAQELAAESRRLCDRGAELARTLAGRGGGEVPELLRPRVPAQGEPFRLGALGVALARAYAASPVNEAEQVHPFVFLSAEVLCQWRPEDGPLPRFQELWAQGKLHWATIDIKDLLRGKYREEYLIVSHRWETMKEPDPKCEQLKVLQRFLQDNPRIKWVWLDYHCLPQGKCLDVELRALFRKTLSIINYLYISMTVLVVFDFQYIGRFWTSYEAWLSMQTAGSDGLGPAPLDRMRVEIRCVGAASSVERSCAQILQSAWHQLNHEAARRELAHSDIHVTNMRDKTEQLDRLETLPARVRSIMMQP